MSGKCEILGVFSFFCRKGTQDRWSVPRGEDGGHHTHSNGISKHGAPHPQAIELVPQVRLITKTH